ncbi:hypothetical protein BDW59DRAFT_164119 [Aspergillus cavernicola]|uniref:Uncharacterized protein n=1 Tax=Aspergillus cavernicola TaxID=176166 RepID=A0ABR4I215_9EURO
MEGCNTSDAPEGGLTGYVAIFLLSLLLPIFLMICVVFCIETRILSLTRASPSDRNDLSWCRCTEEDADSSMASTPSYSMGLLDEGIEDIQIPPLSPQGVVPILDENILPHELLDSIVYKLKIPTLEPKRAPLIALDPDPQTEKDRPNTDLESETESTVMWDGKIAWALKGASIFDDADEEYDAFNARSNMISNQPYSDLWVFQHGLRFIPSIYDRDVYRTIRIEQLPREITLNQILPLVVGEIYCAQLADTIAMTGFNTAILTFVTTNDALQFLAATSNEILTVPGKIVPVHTPTYPMPADMERLVVEEGYTRSIGIFNCTRILKEDISRALASYNRMLSLQVDSIEDGPGVGEVSVKMYSVKAAAQVFAYLKRHATLRKSYIRFLRQDAAYFESDSMLVGPGSANGT